MADARQCLKVHDAGGRQDLPRQQQPLEGGGSRRDQRGGYLALLYTELHSAAHRRGIPGGLVNSVLGGINLVDLVRSDLMYAAALPGSLRSADAIHLAAAIRLQSDVLVAYDADLLAAAVDAGLDVLSPGSPG